MGTKTMARVFNIMLGRIGTCSFLNYDMLVRQEETLKDDPIMAGLARRVEQVNDAKEKAEFAWNQEAIGLREAARKRIRELTDEKYV